MNFEYNEDLERDVETTHVVCCGCDGVEEDDSYCWLFWPINRCTEDEM